MSDSRQLYICVMDISQQGGIESFAIRLASAFESRKVTIVSLFQCDPAYFNPNIQVEFLKSGKYDPKNRLELIGSVKRVNDIVGDGIVIHTYNNIFCLAGLLRPLKIKNMIYTEHSSYFAVRRPVRILRNALLLLSKGIVCQTESSLKKFRQLYVPKVRKIAPSWVKTVPRVERSGRTIRLGFAGRLEQDKGILQFLELVEVCNKDGPVIEAHVFGDGSLACRVEEFEASHSGSLHFHGYIKGVQQRFADLDYLAILSHSESFSIVGIEALAAGCGILYFDDLLGPSDYCDHFNSIALKRGSFLDDPGGTIEDMNELRLGESFSNDCQHSVECFSKSTFVEKWEQVLKDD